MKRFLCTILLLAFSVNNCLALITPLDFRLISDASDIVVRNQYAYLLINSTYNQGGAIIYDVSDPSAISLVEVIRDYDDALSVDFASNKAYFGQKDAFSIYDISNPSETVQLAKVSRTPSEFTNLFGYITVAVLGTKVFVSSRSHSTISVYETSDLENISEIGAISDDSRDGTALHLNSPENIFIKGNYLLVENDYNSSTSSDEGITVLDISSPSNMSEVEYVSIPGLHRVCITGNRLYTTNSSDGSYYLKAFNISDPTNITEIGQAYLGTSGFSDFYVTNERLYYTSSSTFGVYNVSNINSISLIETLSDSDADPNDLRISSLSGIYAVGDTIYTYSSSSNIQEEAFSTFNFDEPAETIPPKVSSLIPANEETSVDLSQNFSVVFDEPIQKGTGSIYIRNGAKDVIERIDISSENIVISGSEMTIIPETDLSNESIISISIQSGAIIDLSNNQFAGIDSTDWIFTSEESITNKSLSLSIPSQFTVEKGRPKQFNIFVYRDQNTQTRERCTLRNNFSNKLSKFIYKPNETIKKLRFKVNKKIIKSAKKSGSNETNLELEFTCGSNSISEEVIIKI